MKKLFLSFLLGLSSVNVLHAEEEVYPVVVLGGGVGALTSAVYLGRAGITPLIIEGSIRGGAIAQSPRVQNWPGELEISGFDLIDKLYHQAEYNGAAILTEEVIAVDFQNRPFTLVTRDIFNPSKTKKILANSCIVALGSTPNLLSVPGEKLYWTHGVYNCAVCDGALYKNQKVAVVGGGDAAVLDAEHLANIASTVYVLVRKDRFKALEEKRLQELMTRPNVIVLFNTTVQEIQGDGEKVTNLIIHRNNVKESLNVSALFLAIGAKPNSQLFRDQLETDEQGYIVLKHDQETSVKGIFAIGDIVDPVYKQAVIAAGQGAIAACQVVQISSKVEKNESIKEEIPLVPSAASPPSPTLKKPTARSSSQIGQVIEIITLEQFQSELAKTTTPICIDFYATWCGPCRTLSPMIEKWAKEHAGKVRFLKINVTKNENLANLYKVKAMPTLVVLNKEGKEITKRVGTQEITQYVNRTDFTKVQ